MLFRSMAIENIIDNIARFLKKDPSEIRNVNFYGKNKRNVTHYGMKINDNVIEDIFKRLLSKSNYKKRFKDIRNFNLKNKFKKKRNSFNSCKIWYFFYNNSFKSGWRSSSCVYRWKCAFKSWWNRNGSRHPHKNCSTCSKFIWTTF